MDTFIKGWMSIPDGALPISFQSFYFIQSFDTPLIIQSNITQIKILELPINLSQNCHLFMHYSPRSICDYTTNSYEKALRQPMDKIINYHPVQFWLYLTVFTFSNNINKEDFISMFNIKDDSNFPSPSVTWMQLMNTFLAFAHLCLLSTY